MPEHDQSGKPERPDRPSIVDAGNSSEAGQVAMTARQRIEPELQRMREMGIQVTDLLLTDSKPFCIVGAPIPSSEQPPPPEPLDADFEPADGCFVGCGDDDEAPPTVNGRS